MGRRFRRKAHGQQIMAPHAAWEGKDAEHKDPSTDSSEGTMPTEVNTRVFARMDKDDFRRVALGWHLA